MSQLQVQHRTALVNGGNRRRGDQDLGNGTDNFRKEYQSNRCSRSGSGNQGRMEGGAHQHINQAGSVSKDKAEALTHCESRGESQGPCNQHPHCLTACLVGQPVEVQVKCGSIYSGVFHLASAEKDHGIVLKMARLIKDVSSKGKCDISAMRPHESFVINTKDLVQIIAKDVPLKGETLQNGRMRENRAEMVTDSILSQGRHGDIERELKPWTPDAEDFKDLGLESTFENTWNRNWNQFEINRTLFGVESTFDEELYTTKLEKGPQMREREREAWRIAREIEGQSVKSLHLAEERGVRSSKDFELLDEESRFSSVLRSSEDVGEENEDANMDALNGETFNNLQNHMVASMTAVADEHNLMKAREIESKKTRRPSSADLKKDSIVASVDINVAAAESLENSHKEKSPRAVVSNKHSVRVGGFASPRPSSSIGDTTGLQALNLDPGSPHVTPEVLRDFNVFKQQNNAKEGRQREEQVNELKSFGKTLQELTVIKQQTAAVAGNTHKTAAACAPPASALPLPTSITNPISTIVGLDSGVDPAPSKQLTPSSRAVDSTRVATTERGFSASGLPQSEQTSMNFLSIDMPVSPMISATSTAVPSSPSSSSDVSSTSSFSKKSSLNPHAKEFKLNPNAKSFTPNFTPLRPPSPVVQGSLYVPGMLPPGPPMQGVPIGVTGNPHIPQAGQPAAKYAPYNNMGVAGASGGAPFLPSPGTFTSGAPMLPPLGGGQATMKVSPQLQPPAGGHSYGSQQAIRYPSQAPVVPASTYLHPNAHMYSQQMMFGQPGQVLYYQPYTQGIPMPPPQPTSAALQLQTNHRGMPEMQVCVTPPYIPGQQHFVPQVQIPQLSNSMQPTAAPLPNSMPTIQPPQGGMMPQTVPSPSGTIPKTPAMRLGGVGAST